MYYLFILQCPTTRKRVHNLFALLIEMVISPTAYLRLAPCLPLPETINVQDVSRGPRSGTSARASTRNVRVGKLSSSGQPLRRSTTESGLGPG